MRPAPVKNPSASIAFRPGPRRSAVLGVLGILGSFACESPVTLAATPPGTLVVGLDNKPKSGDPRLIGTDANSQYLEELRFLPLVSFDEAGGVRFVVAESVTPDGKLGFKVKIRKGVKFVNGRELDADDVVANYQHQLVGKAGLPPSPRKGAFESVKEVRKTGAHEVVFTLKEPDAAFVVNLVIGLLPKEALNAGPEDLVGKGYESGPFVLEKSTDTEWTLARNGKYTAAPHGGAMPKLERVAFKIIADSNTRYAALVKGDLDLVQNGIDADKIVEVRKKESARFDINTRTSSSTTFLAFNFKQKAFQNPDVRKAIAKGINREEILQYVMQGLGTKATSMFPPGLPYHHPAPDVGYDPAGAMALLDKAGYKDPDGKGPQSRLRFSLKVPTNKERIAIAKAVAGQLKRVGIDAQIESLEFGTFSKQLSDGLVPAWIAPWTGYKDPDHLRYVFHSNQVPPVGGNRGFYSNPKVDALLDAGRAELDMGKRQPTYLEAQRLLSDDSPYVYLWYKLNHVVTAKNVKGYKLYADGRYVSLTETTK
jgi:peptide/nickel transport system substrate-binding protein